jgi:4-diphosphocytidyl-2-C-methyl-D-erythritol kinase
VLVHPGFGISSAWAYEQLQRFPQALHGRPGRARELVDSLRKADVSDSGKLFYNSLEAPALDKYPLLTLFQEFFRANGALATLMSGSGSTTFAIAQDQDAGHQLVKKFKDHFGSTHWSAVCLLN